MRRIAALVITISLAVVPHAQATAMHASTIGHSLVSCMAAAGVPDEDPGLRICAQIVQEGERVRMDALGVPGMYCMAVAVYGTPDERALLTPSAFQIADASGTVHWSWSRAPYRAWGDTVYGGVVCSRGVDSTSTDMRTVQYTVRWTGVVGPSHTALAFPLRVWIDPSFMSDDAYPVLHAQTVPGARCSGSVEYTTEPQVPFSAGAQIVPAGGQVSWTWHEETTGPGGLGTVTCTIAGADTTASAVFTVTRSPLIVAP